MRRRRRFVPQETVLASALGVAAFGGTLGLSTGLYERAVQAQEAQKVSEKDSISVSDFSVEGERRLCEEELEDVPEPAFCGE